MKEALDKLLRGPVAPGTVKDDIINEKDTIILVSHVGPHDSSNYLYNY